MNQQRFDRSINNFSDRAKRRKEKKEYTAFEPRIKDKFWWKSLTHGEKYHVYSRLVDRFYKSTEDEMKKVIKGNLVKKRELIINAIIT
jgi:hypothetical protein